jgi:hypothetical protein
VQDLYGSCVALGNKIVSLMGGGGDAVGFIATPGAGNIQPRIDGANAAIKASGKNINLKQITSGAELPAENTAINGYVLSHKDTLKGIFAVDAGSTQTVGQIVGKYGLAGSVASGGFDLTPQTLQSVKSGDLDFTIDQSPYQQGFLPVIGLYLFQLSGGLVFPSTTDTGLSFVDKNSVDPYMATTKPVRGLHQGAEADQAVRRDLASVTGSGHRRARARRWPPPARPLAPLAPRPRLGAGGCRRRGAVPSIGKKDRRGDVSETAERAPVSGPPAGPAAEPGRPGIRASRLGRIGIRLVQQREATVFVVAVALVIYFSSVSSSFFTKDDLVNLSQIIAPLAIIACGEVFLLICGELDLSVGFVYGFAPFLMHYLIDFYGVPAIPAMILCLVFGLAFGYINAFITIALGVPSFIATLGTGLVLLGFTLVTSNAYPALIPDSAAGSGTGSAPTPGP